LTSTLGSRARPCKRAGGRATESRDTP
jgi:hypothetical protein